MYQQEEKNYLTKEWYENLVAELSELKSEKLPKVLERLKDAIGQGDISENAEYDTATMEKDFIEARMVEISSMLKDVEIIDEKSSKGAKEVRYGSKVKLLDVEKNKGLLLHLEKSDVEWFTIVGSWEIALNEWNISFECPIWSAIKGKKVWDVCRVRMPHGRFEIKVSEIK